MQSNYKSVLEIIQEHTEGRVLPNEKHVNISKTPRMEDDSLGNGSRIYWKHRQKIRILPRNKKAPVTNVVEDLFDSDLMDAIEWTTAES